MPILATDSPRFSHVVKHEYQPSIAFCREMVTVNEAAIKTYSVGTVLGRTLAGGAGVATAGTNTGNGAMGAITVSGTAQVGTYKLSITKAAANAGDFQVVSPTGEVIGVGSIGVLFSSGGLSFTLADGAVDFVVGDSFTIAVTGTVKYKIAEATATDGSLTAIAVVLGDKTGNAADFSVAATTDTKVQVAVRGPMIVSKAALVLGASIDTQAEKDAVYASLAAKGILVNDTI